jgi:hypothetical protein
MPAAPFFCRCHTSLTPLALDAPLFIIAMLIVSFSFSAIFIAFDAAFADFLRRHFFFFTLIRHFR